MSKYLDEVAWENSTYVLSLELYDENDAIGIPKTLTWTLTDTAGVVINSREDVSETPASTINIVLSGDDLAIVDDSPVMRLVALTATYDSTLGTDLPVKEEYKFMIKNIRTE